MLRIFLLTVIVLMPSVSFAKEEKSVPFASELRVRIPYYNKLTNRIATAGVLDYESLSELSYKNIDLVIDLRMEQEGAIESRLMASRLNVPYKNVQVHPERTISDGQLELFAQVFESESGLIVIHCEDGSRTGAMWARYLISKGMSRDDAFKVGRMIGMSDNMEKKLIIQLNRVRE